MLIKLNTWLYLEIRIQDEIKIKRLIIFRIKGLKYSNSGRI